MKLFGASKARRPRGLSVIDARLTVRGDIDTDATIRIDGCVEGSLHRAGTLIVGVTGRLVGDVEATDVIVAGIVHGSVTATGRVEIEPGAEVHGEVRASNMTMREGALLDGQMAIGAPPVSVVALGHARRLELTQSAALPARAHG